MVANSVIEFRADPDAKFTRLYLLLLNAAYAESVAERIKEAAN
jgi:hypothetical protein